MLKRKLLSLGVAGALALLAQPAWSATVVNNRAVEVVGAGATADPLIAVEANRKAIISRVLSEQRATLFASGIAESTFRNALDSLRADQLLAASLVGSFAEIAAIVSQAPAEGASLQRFVPMTPTGLNAVTQLPAAEAFLVRDGDSLSLVKATQLPLTHAQAQLVGYFVADRVMTGGGWMASGTPKDGTGTGAGSWIGFVAGGNFATGTSSAVAAGSNNLASGQNAFVGAGFANQANGVSSLVIGGFDNRANNIDALVGAGAGNRATGARSVIVGGGYNLASGNFSFIGGGGRDGIVSTPAGTDAKDHVASGLFATIPGGTGNRATGPYSFVGGGAFNTASGDAAVVVGGNSGVPTEGNVASGQNSFVGSGWLNIASGTGSAVLGGQRNKASGFGSVAMGQFALTENVTPTPHGGTFVFSDGSSGNFRSAASNSFNVLATGGMRLATGAVNLAGEANATRYVDVLANGSMSFDGNNSTKIVLDDTDPAKNIGVQAFTVYSRTNEAFAWYLNGVFSGTQYDPGAGGAVLATLQTGPTTTTVTGTFRAQAFTATSDRDAKTDFAPLDAKTILAKVAQMPIATWSYKNETGAGIRHIGPVAQDFRQLFDVGYDDKSIATVDADGVAFAAIKGLYEEVQERDARIALQQAQIDTQAARIAAQQAQLAAQLQRIAKLEQHTGELAASQLQLHDMATVVVKLQQEMASLRQTREVALVAK